MTKKAGVFLACCVLALATGAFGQANTGQISGTVMDASGAVIVGATIKVTQDATGISRTVATTSNGTFVVPALASGRYTVEITYSGFQPYTVKELDVTVGADHPLKVTLETGTVASTVTVSEMAVTVQTSETAISSLVDGKTLVQLPLNRRNPLHFLGLIPGVTGHSAQATSSTGTVTHFVNGDRGRGIETQLDGISISDPIIPRGELTNAPVNPDMVQEFRVITAIAPAQFGRNSGAQIQMVSKGGSNEWHGNAYHFLRNTVLDANNFFSNHTPDPFTKMAPTARENLKHNQFGGTVGGPILKSKLFFFFSYEGQRRTQTLIEGNTALTTDARAGLFRFVRGTVQPTGGASQNFVSTSLVDPATGALRPGVVLCGGTVTNNCIDTFNIAAADPRALGLNSSMTALTNLYPAPNDFSGGDGLNTATFRWNAPSLSPVDTYAGKIDYILNSSHEIFGRYTLAWRNDLVGDFINGALPRTPNSGVGRSRLSRNQSLAIGWKWLVASNIVSNATIGFTRNTLFFADTSHPIRAGDPVFSVVPELRTTTFTTPFIYWGGTERHPEHLQAKEDMSWQRGSHSFSFGGEFRFYRFNNLRNVGSNPAGSGISVFPSVFFTAAGTAFQYTNQIVANYTCASGTAGNCSSFTNAIPGTSTNQVSDRNRLINMFNELLGVVGSMDQIMYSNGAQYVPGNGLTMYQRQKEWSLYFHDDWRLNSRLTLNAGIRYEFNGVPYDTSGSQVVPNQPLNQPGVTFLPAGPGTGRDWYQADRNNFGPNIGLAYDPWGNGKTVVRTSYRTSYNRLVGWALNVVEQRQPAIGFDPQILAAINPATGFPYRIPELSSHPSVTVVNGLATLSAPNPNVIQFTPTARRAESPFFFADDFKTAYVHTFVLNVQREIRPNLVAEVGYVGNLGRGLFEFLNVNQIDLTSNGFLQEFLNAKNNLAICRANQVACRTAAGSTSTTFASFANLGLTGQVAVPSFTALFTGSTTGSQTSTGFTNSTTIGQFDINNIGTMVNALDRGTSATNIQNSRGPLAAGLGDSFFRPNPQFDVAGLGSSSAKSWYNSLQMQIRGSFRNSVQFAANYTWQKSIDTQSDETVGAGTGFSFPADSANPGLSRGRSDFDVNHIFRAYAIYDVPIGRGKRFLNDLPAAWQHAFGGWQFNTIVDWSSGFPFTVSSGSQTLNYFITSPANCVAGARNEMFLNGSDPRGSGVFLFNSAARTNSFSIPAPGAYGTCGRNSFTGPGYLQFDFGIFKTFEVTEKWKLDFRTELFNAFNSANFNNPSTTSIQSSIFGRITSLRAPNRIIQFALKLNF